MRIVVAVDHQDRSLNLRESLRLDAVFLQADDVVPSLRMTFGIDREQLRLLGIVLDGGVGLELGMNGAELLQGGFALDGTSCPDQLRLQLINALVTRGPQALLD